MMLNILALKYWHRHHHDIDKYYKNTISIIISSYNILWWRMTLIDFTYFLNDLKYGQMLKDNTSINI